MSEIIAKFRGGAGGSVRGRRYLRKVLRELDKQMQRALDKGNCRAVEAFAIAFNIVEDRLHAIRRADQRQP